MAAYSEEQLDAVLNLLRKEWLAEDEALAKLLQGEGNRYKLRSRGMQDKIIMDMNDDLGSDFAPPVKTASPKRKRASSAKVISPTSPKEPKVNREQSDLVQATTASGTNTPVLEDRSESPERKRRSPRTRR